MNLANSLRATLVVAASLAAISASRAAAAVQIAISYPDAQSNAEQLDRRLQSASLLRATGEDAKLVVRSGGGEQARLRAHFDAVLVLLIENMATSLDTALDRLETHRGETWTADQRAAWKRLLVKHRLANIVRLRLYQLRGLFPQNHADAQRAVPVFVDPHDTACAVGHLMRESGWEQVVANIEATNNLVFVTDVNDGPLVEWVAYSGLTQEEAALIQPSYQPIFQATLQELVDGGSLERDGVRYENFAFEAGEETAPNLLELPQIMERYLGRPVDLAKAVEAMALSPYADMVQIGAVRIDWEADGLDLSRLGASVGGGGGYLDGCEDCGFITPHKNWIFYGAYIEGDLGAPDEDISGGLFDSWATRLSFDVVPTGPGGLVNAASVLTSLHSNYNLVGVDNPFDDEGAGTLVFDTNILDQEGAELARFGMSFDEDSEFEFFRFADGEEVANFEPQSRIRVESTIYSEGVVSVSSLVHSFNVIPEPATCGLLLVGCVLVGVRLRRR